MEQPIAVLIVERERLVMAGLLAALHVPDVRVVGQVADLAAELVPALGLQPDVVVLGALTIDDELIGVCERIAAEAPRSRLLVLASSVTPADWVRAMEAGVSGCLPMDVPPEELVSAVRNVAGGAPANSINPRLFPEYHPDHAPAQALARLTRRERAVAELLTDGLTNKEIAAALALSPNTVKAYVSSALRKLSVAHRSALAGAVAAARNQAR
ncbi:MAG: response regulator transcription factor [Chloroflexi bacterium]|nr:response regulator transcription factor [Chloroflexota bacterium]